MSTRHLLRALLCALILAASVEVAAAPSRPRQPAGEGGEPLWSLEEVKDKSRIFLLTTRSRVLDARGIDPSGVIKELGAGKVRIHPYPYRVIARKLNEYIRKRRGMTAVVDPSEADYVIYFNVLEYRRTLNGVYPYGELFVILTTDGRRRPQPPRIVWRTKRATWAEDAAKEFLRELKRVRGEK